MTKKINFKHNKRRNSGLVYEFLLRKISESVLEKDIKTSKVALNIIKKYYSPGTQLHEEKQLFDIIIGTRGASSGIASGILQEIKKSASKLDFRLTDIKKSNLLREVNHAFGKTFFSNFEIEDYKAFASLQLFINGCNPKSALTESIQRVKLQESLINFMVSKKRNVNEYQEFDGADELSYNIAVNKYNKKYTSALNESQKNLLSSYTSSLTKKGNGKKLEKYLNKQRTKLLEFLRFSHSSPEIKNDKLILEKLSKAEVILEGMNFKDAGPTEVEDLMLYCKLVEEIAS